MDIHIRVQRPKNLLNPRVLAIAIGHKMMEKTTSGTLIRLGFDCNANSLYLSQGYGMFFILSFIIFIQSLNFKMVKY